MPWRGATHRPAFRAPTRRRGRRARRPTLRGADHACMRGHNQSASVWGLKMRIPAKSGPHAGFGDRPMTERQTKIQKIEKSSRSVLTPGPGADYIRSTPTATPHGDAATALLLRNGCPRLRITFGPQAKVVPEAPLFDKCRQKEKRGRRCSCGLAFGPVVR
jgi:hypothetical protein